MPKLKTFVVFSGILLSIIMIINTLLERINYGFWVGSSIVATGIMLILVFCTTWHAVDGIKNIESY